MTLKNDFDIKYFSMLFQGRKKNYRLLKNGNPQCYFKGEKELLSA